MPVQAGSVRRNLLITLPRENCWELGWTFGFQAYSLSVLGAFFTYKEGTQAISVPIKYFPALITFIISFTPLQSLIKLISLKDEGNISNGLFKSF